MALTIPSLPPEETHMSNPETSIGIFRPTALESARHP